MMTRSRGWIAGAMMIRAVVLAALGGASGCAPQIRSFRVTTGNYVCASSRPELVWDVDGYGLIAADKMDNWNYLSTSAGRIQVPAETMTYRLVAWKRGAKTERADQRIQVVDLSRPMEIGSNSTCDGKQAAASFALQDYDPAVEVRKLDNALGHDVTLEHDGASFTVPKNGSLDLAPATTGKPRVPAAGQWRLTAKLNDGEKCEDRSARELATLSVTMTAACAPAAAAGGNP